MKKLLIIATMIIAAATNAQVTYQPKGEVPRDANIVTAVNLDPLQNSVNRLMIQVQGSNVWFSVTNYYGALATPSLSLHEMVNGVDETVWDERTRHGETYTNIINEVANNLIPAAIQDMPDKAWGRYTSGTGADAPSDTTWVSTKTLVFSGGLEFRTVGGLAFLTSNGMALDISANTNGYTQICDLQSGVLIEFRKTAASLAWINIDGITVKGNTITIPLVETNQIKDNPILYVAPQAAPLTIENYIPSDSESSPFNCTWDYEVVDVTNRIYTATVTPKSGSLPSMYFFCAGYMAEGINEVYMPGTLKAEGGITATDGTIWKPVHVNGTLTWEKQ